MTRNLRQIGDDDAVTHAQCPRVTWLATACGIRVSIDGRAQQRLMRTDDPVDCMTCLVLEAKGGPWPTSTA